ncbi:pantoate--beta-alanine ligase [Sulfurimonas sp. SAG-AH-194-I05]|nr:pantoate--beta-alanine ligase [Sulfurimonas sp. SAG-AH-194-I05]MDF1874866.1 pantoate--beta-alanine ligase [Sulfurimonas sp. SAG-AH-194-I05]
MKIISNPLELKKYLQTLNVTIGFVPTMGALHEGHLSLIKEAKRNNAIVVVSIFVNPTQFLKGEDLDKYPRKDDADTKVCELSGVDILFFPHAKDIYTEDEVSILCPKVRGFVLEGFSRPGHFNGVLTVVNKLLNIVSPTNAYFGKKDAQQLHLIKLMVEQLFMRVNIIEVETMRENDGLAMSSRNVYLSKEQRKEALKISSSLKTAFSMVSKGELSTCGITKIMREILSPLEIFYVVILDRKFHTLKKVEIGNSIVLVEVKVGETRLLDNMWL